MPPTCRELTGKRIANLAWVSAYKPTWFIGYNALIYGYIAKIDLLSPTRHPHRITVVQKRPLSTAF